MQILRDESLSKNQSASYSDLPSSLKEKMDLDEDVEFFNSNMFSNNNLDINNNSKKYYYLNDDIKKHKSDKKRDILPKFKITLENIKEENSDLETSREIFKDKKANLNKLSFTEKSCHFKNSKIFNQNNKNIFKKILNTISENNQKNKQLFTNLMKDKVSKKLIFYNEKEKIKDKENIKVHNICENLLKTNSPLKIENFQYLSPPIKKIQNFKSKKKKKILKLKNENKSFSTKKKKKKFLKNLGSHRTNNFQGSNLKSKLQRKNNYYITKSESIKNLKEKRKKLFKKMKNCSLNTFKNSSSSINKKQSSMKNINQKLKLYNKNFLKNIYVKEFDFSLNKYVSISKKEKSINLKNKSKRENQNLFKKYQNLGMLTKENNKINYNNIQNIYSKKKILSKKNKQLFSNLSPLNRKLFSYKEKYLDRSRRMFKNLYIKCLSKKFNDKLIDQKTFGNVKFRKKKRKSKNLKKKTKMEKVKKNNFSFKKNAKRDLSCKEIFNKKKGHLINLY